MRRIAFISVPLLIVLVSLAAAQDGKQAPAVVSGGPEVGTAAPDFALPWATAEGVHYAQNDFLKLSAQRGSNVILAFYPMDWSGGCTTEVCSFRDGWTDLEKLHAKLLAISGDYVFSHQHFADFYKLKFPLLSDHDHAVAKEYGVFQPLLGGINKRSAFLIDKNGIVRYRNLDFKATNKDDYAALRAALEKLDVAEAKAEAK
jgi:peroxiredoxin